MFSSPAFVRFAMTRSGFRISTSWSPWMSPALDRARALLDEAQLGLVARVHADRDLLEVQQHVHDVFLHALDRGVLVQHAVDLDLGDRRPGQRRQQHATKRVAERVAEAPLERFDDDARMTRTLRGHLHDARLQKLSDGSLHKAPHDDAGSRKGCGRGSIRPAAGARPPCRSKPFRRPTVR
jgi:hypothetical protein